MFKSIGVHLSRIADFSGREARTPFWWWVLAVIILNIVVSMGLSMAVTAGAVATALEASKSQGEAAMQAAMMQSMLPRMPMLIWSSIALSVVNVILLGAAFVRRLHDGGFPGLLALLPLIGVVATIWLSFDQLAHLPELMQRAAQATTPDAMAELQQQEGWKSLVGWLPMLLVGGFGLVKSQPVANRWGEPPLAS